MSKLYKNYMRLKRKNKDVIYIIKCGVFYLILNDDAKICNKLFSFTIVKVNDDLIKCSFPISKINEYTRKLTILNLNYIVIDDLFINYNNEVINKIKKLDISNLTPKQAYFLLIEFKNKLR